MKQEDKNKRKNTKKETKERRNVLRPYTISCKFYEKSLSKEQKIILYTLFKEAKWFYNFLLTIKEDYNSTHEKLKIVPVLNPKTKLYENRELKLLSSQMKQSIITRLIENKLSIKNKKTGKGKLKFKKDVNSIPLKQFGNTFKILSKHFVSIQNVKFKLRINGLNQIKNKSEISNATFIKTGKDFYLNITYFDLPKSMEIPKDHIGIDMNIKDSLVFSNGIKVNLKTPISKGIKKYQRKLSKQIKGSKNYFKTLKLLQKEYEKLTQKRLDNSQKIVSYLNKNFIVHIQDEMIKAWMKRYGKTVSISSLGTIKKLLKQCNRTQVVPRRYPSTQLCPKCGCLNKIPLSQRFYKCECGFEMDRDIKSAICIRDYSLRNSGQTVPLEQGEYTPLEMKTTTDMLKYLKSIENITASLIKKKEKFLEAHELHS